MPYEPFYERFPELAKKETRTITTSNHPYLPDDEYALIEAYCNEPDCDCRRVFFNVVSRRRQEIEAVITYGWENKKYYAEWFGRNPPPGVMEELQGPALNSASSQSKLAPALLQVVKQVLQDRNYVNRLKRHYQMFKETVDSEDPDEDQAEFQLPSPPKLARNAPCPCGSGKKYKNCCGKR